MKNKNIQVIKNQTFDQERSLYGIQNSIVEKVNFEGPNDGESCLKECSNIDVSECKFALRYPLWHLKFGTVSNCVFTNDSRAPLWYVSNSTFINLNAESVKIFRECKNIIVEKSNFISEEPFWKISNLRVKDSNIEGFYGFFGSKNVILKGVSFKGKYSFQYMRNVKIADSSLEAKDAFWHSKNITVINSKITGEYLGWYSKNLKLINCTIISHQPLCYCKNLKLINCKMEGCDLAFENSRVKATIVGSIESIKNPRSGKIVVETVNNIIKEEYKYKPRGKIVLKSHKHN